MKLIQHFKKETQVFTAFADGKVIRLEDVADQAFSNGLIGEGLAVLIQDNRIYAPCEGTITMIAATKHAFTIATATGIELLIHIGLDQTKEANAFQYHVKEFDRIDQNTHIVTIQEEYFHHHKDELLVFMVVLNHQTHPIQTMTTASSILRGKKLFTCK